MEKKMNKRELINEIKKHTNYNDENCNIIVNILEDNFLNFKKNKDRVITQLIENLNISEEEANSIYNLLVNIIKLEIKRKIMHPFRNQN